MHKNLISKVQFPALIKVFWTKQKNSLTLRQRKLYFNEGLAKKRMYRGDIYLQIHLSKEDKYKKLDSNALQIAYDSYQKAIELDTKKEYFDDIKLKLYVCGEQFYNKGVEL